MEIDFGKYAGKSLEEIGRVDPEYLHVLIRDQLGPAELQAAAARVLEAQGRLGRPAAARSRIWLAWLLVGSLLVLIGGLAVLTLLALQGSSLDPTAAPISVQATVPPARVALDLLQPTREPEEAAAATPEPTYTSAPTQARAPIAAAEATAPATLSPPAVDEPAVCGSLTEDAISADQARDHLGEYRTVEFQVVRTYNSGKAVFLDSHDPYQGYFEVVIFPDRWPEFTEPPEKYFKGQCVAVRGRIELYRGTPEIVLKAAADIRIID